VATLSKLKFSACYENKQGAYEKKRKEEADTGQAFRESAALSRSEVNGA